MLQKLTKTKDFRSPFFQRMKPTVLLGTLLTACSLLFSCSKSDDPAPLPEAPTVSVSVRVDGTPLSNGDAIEVGSKILLDVTVNAPGGVRSLEANGDSYTASDLGATANSTQGVIQLTDSITANPGTLLSYKFVARDELEQSSDTLTFSLQVVSPSLDSYTVTLTGGFDGGSLNSFYNVLENEIYSIEEAAASAANIDLVFYYFDENPGVLGAEVTPGYVLSSTASTNTAFLFDKQAAFSFESFTTRHSTEFISLPAGVSFDELATDEDLQNIFSEAVGAGWPEDRTQLAEGDLFVVGLDPDHARKWAIIRITGTSNPAGSKTRELSFDIKVGNRPAVTVE